MNSNMMRFFVFYIKKKKTVVIKLANIQRYFFWLVLTAEVNHY